MRKGVEGEDEDRYEATVGTMRARETRRKTSRT
jgi:hypothetical protein